MFLDPKRVNEVFAALLDATNGPVSMSQVAEALAGAGMVNPKTHRAPSRQTVWQILNHPANTDGRQLLARSKSRATVAGRLADGA